MNWTAPFANMLPVAGLHRIEHETLAVRTSHLKRGLCQPLRTCLGSRVSKAPPHEIDQASHPRGIAIVEGLMDDREGVNSGEGLHDLSTVKDALSFDGGNQFHEHCGDRDGQGVCLYFCNCFCEFAAANRLALVAINHTDRPLGVFAKGMSGGDRRGNAGHRCEAYRTGDLSETEDRRLHPASRIARTVTRFEDSLFGAAFGVALLLGLLIAALSVGGPVMVVTVFLMGFVATLAWVFSAEIADEHQAMRGVDHLAAKFLSLVSLFCCATALGLYGYLLLGLAL